MRETVRGGGAEIQYTNAHKSKQTHRWCWRQEPGLPCVCVSRRSVNSYLGPWLKEAVGSMMLSGYWSCLATSLDPHCLSSEGWKSPWPGPGCVLWTFRELTRVLHLPRDGQECNCSEESLPALCLDKLPHFSLRPRSRRSCDRKKAKKTIRCLQTWALLGSEMPPWQDKNKRINRSKILGAPWHTVLCLNVTEMPPPSSTFPAHPPPHNRQDRLTWQFSKHSLDVKAKR